MPLFSLIYCFLNVFTVCRKFLPNYINSNKLYNHNCIPLFWNNHYKQLHTGRGCGVSQLWAHNKKQHVAHIVSSSSQLKHTTDQAIPTCNHTCWNTVCELKTPSLKQVTCVSAKWLYSESQQTQNMKYGVQTNLCPKNKSGSQLLINMVLTFCHCGLWKGQIKKKHESTGKDNDWNNKPQTFINCAG